MCNKICMTIKRGEQGTPSRTQKPSIRRKRVKKWWWGTSDEDGWCVTINLPFFLLTNFHSNLIHHPVWGLIWASNVCSCSQVGHYFGIWLSLPWSGYHANHSIDLHRAVIGFVTQKLGMPVKKQENDNKKVALLVDIIDKPSFLHNSFNFRKMSTCYSAFSSAYLISTRGVQFFIMLHI